MKDALASEAFLAVARRGRVVVDYRPRAEFGPLVAREFAAFGTILRELGVEPE